MDVERAVTAGAHGVLVGTAILKAEDPVEMYHKLCISRGSKMTRVKICGLMNQHDIHLMCGSGSGYARFCGGLSGSGSMESIHR